MEKIEDEGNMKTETSERIVYDAGGVVIARDRLQYIVYTRQVSLKGNTPGTERLANATFHGNIAQAAIEASTRTKDSVGASTLEGIAKSVIRGQREIFAALKGCS